VSDSVDTPDDDVPAGDVPAVQASESSAPGRRTGAKANRRSLLARKTFSFVIVLLALGLVGGIYSAFAPGGSTTAAAAQSTDVATGKALYQQGCITCHGNAGVGVSGRGPSLVGTGSAAVEYQVGSGRMPLAGQAQQAPRKHVSYTSDEIDAMANYVESLGGGPELPARGTNLRDGDLAEGGELFRLNCASCHNFVGKGGALSSGKYAPPLTHAGDRDIYAAMLSGPGQMPVFSNNQLSDQQKRDIINYLQHVKAQPDPGGLALGRVGPVPEGLLLWVVGLGLLVFITLWIGVKS